MVTNVEPFKKLYGELLSAVKDHPGDMCAFFSQTGKHYYHAGKKLLFIGKSVNGWVNNARDVEELFDPHNPDRIVNRDDEIVWVEDAAETSSGYNTNRSAYWRVIKKVTQDFYGKDDWYNHIAWTNLYKISPWAGNPSGTLRQMQEAVCVKILNEEIKTLKPDVVIFLSSGWEDFYLKSTGLDPQKNQVKTWGAHETRCQTKDGITWIMSPHPMGKEEGAHVTAILEILREEK
ncbi:MAG: hypothetical protein LBQ88_17605 [Treponema sp.]|jgi:hypothetical protein|nr:hypothetical protein [Treponema sp.]